MKSILSFTVTVVLLFGCMLALHETHSFSESILSVSDRLTFLELACPVLSVLAYVSPVFSVITMLSKSDRSDFPLAIVVAQAGQGLACTAYGIHINDAPFLLSSLVGLGFQSAWLLCWYICLRRVSRRLVHPALFLLALFIAFTLLVLFQVMLLSASIVGYISCLSSLLLCVSPLTNLGLIVRSRNSASIPMVMSVIMLLGNAGWAAYGILLKDMFVYLPSLFGFLMTSFQLIVTAWCAGILPYDLTFLQALFPLPTMYHQLSPVTALELGRRVSSVPSVPSRDE